MRRSQRRPTRAMLTSVTQFRTSEGASMTKWMTREHPRVDRVVCPWLIDKFIDKNAEFLYVPADSLMDEAKKQGATPYDGKKGVDMEFGHHGAECSFDAFLKKYDLTKNDPAL